MEDQGLGGIKADNQLKFHIINNTEKTLRASL